MSSSYTTTDTIWPSAITLNPAIKQLVARYYEIADIPDTRAGDRFVAEVFTSNGTIEGPGGHRVTGEPGKAYVASLSTQYTVLTSRLHRQRFETVEKMRGLLFQCAVIVCNGSTSMILLGLTSYSLGRWK